MNELRSVQEKEGLEQLVRDVLLVDLLQNPRADHSVQVRLCEKIGEKRVGRVRVG